MTVSIKAWSHKPMFSSDDKTKLPGTLNPGSIILCLLVCQTALGAAPNAKPPETGGNAAKATDTARQSDSYSHGGGGSEINTSSTDWPAPPPAKMGPGIGTPYLGPGASAYTPAGGADPNHPHIFHLQAAKAAVFEGGSLQGANSENWPILVGQKGSVYMIRLKVGAIREPHWHPSAWELNYIISGKVRWSFVGPNSSQDVLEGGAGDLIMIPQGHFHYFENASATEDLIVLATFNTDSVEPKDDVALAQSISSLPPSVMAALFGVDVSVFKNLPVVKHRLPIVVRPNGETGANPK
jgi:oxalate decarboxylase